MTEPVESTTKNKNKTEIRNEHLPVYFDLDTQKLIRRLEKYNKLNNYISYEMHSSCLHFLSNYIIEFEI